MTTHPNLSWQERALSAERDNATLRTALTWCRDTLRTVTNSIDDLHNQLPNTAAPTNAGTQPDERRTK